MTSNEVYPRSALALAVVELRHPSTEPLSSSALGLIKAGLAAVTPIQRWEEVMTIDVQSGTQEVRRFPKFISRDQRTAVSFRTEAIAVETTNYEGFAGFRDVVETAVRVRHDVDPLDAIERVGLRYIDEVRVPVAGPVAWGDWISPKLLGPDAPHSSEFLSVVQQQGVTVFAAQTPGDSITLRYGLGEGQAVVGSPNLARPGEFSGPFFLIDIDGAWAAPEGMIPEFDVDDVIGACTRLHGPIKDVFESLVSEKLRNEVFRNVI
ncbi:TIGR04255 family protein [Pseudarthrobacter sp. H2]|uniref:TIGR04255 family protein n=1 Tax=Pseudarthrobacter sp. H2 TaxID=3418415 RepID=UPI003CF3082D